MYKISCLSVLILYSCLDYTHQYKIENVQNQDSHFDLIMFSQHWPITMCKAWMEKEPEYNCAFPDRKDRWTLHGIWPTKFNESGPSDCNSTWHFNPEEIKSLRSDLEQAWTNIFNGSNPDYLWKHEWEKHGTCGTVLEPLNSEFKYFNKGIEWNQKYYLADMLSAAQITPSDTRKLTVEELANAVKAQTGKEPMLGCSEHKGVRCIEEILICMDKSLNLIDCGPVDKSCDQGFIFPATV